MKRYTYCNALSHEMWSITKHYLQSDARIVTMNRGITAKKIIFHLIVLRSLCKSPVHVWEKRRTFSTRDKRILWGILWKHRLENTSHHFRNINKRYLCAHKIRSSMYENTTYIQLNSMGDTSFYCIISRLPQFNWQISILLGDVVFLIKGNKKGRQPSIIRPIIFVNDMLYLWSGHAFYSGWVGIVSISDKTFYRTISQSQTLEIGC